MTHGRPPRKPRRVSLNPVLLARNAATRLTPAEVAATIGPLRLAAQSMRQGVATQHQWSELASALNVALAIERQGIVRGLIEHLRAAQGVLDTICHRALASGQWRAPTLYWQEIDHITALVDLHEYQLQQLSYGEAHRAVASATQAVRQAGGRVHYIDQTEAQHP